MSKRANNLEVKKINRNRVFRCINSKVRTSKPEIANELGLSIPTIMQIVNELMNDGLIIDVGEYASTGGRKAAAIASVKDNYFSVGLDITRNHIGFAVTDLSGDILMHKRIHHPYRNDVSYYKELAKYAEDFILDYSNKKSVCLGIGISIPGIIDSTNAKIVYSHALSVKNLDLSVFRKYINYNCIFINDANSAAIAEVYHYSNKKDTVYLSLSNSVGGAIIKVKNSNYNQESIENYLYMGNNCRAGEFGHMTLIPKGERCYCGKIGCSDSYVSAISLAKNTDNRLELFFERLELNDAKMSNIWENYLDYLSILINNLRMIFDCDIIIGGYVGSHIENYLNKLIEKTQSRNTFESDASYIQACKYKIEASALGAALVHVDAFLSSV